MAVDVCRALGAHLKAGGDVNTSQATNPLRDDEKRFPPCLIGGKKPCVISESGLYKLIMRSDKPEAKAFQD